MKSRCVHIFQSDRACYRPIFMLMILLVTSISVNTMGQKQGYFWYFGKNAGLDFTGFDPLPLINSQMDAPEGAAAISDSTGKLLFYTNGVDIWNSNHVKVNSTGLSGDPSSTQSATIVPDPDTVDQYFVFTTKSFITGNPDNSAVNLYKIRIKSGETGTIYYDYAAAKGTSGLITNVTEKFVAVPFTYSTNKTGYWFLMHEFGTNRFVKVKLDSIWHDPEYQPIGSVHQNDASDDGTNRGAAGQMKVNDLRTRLALAVEGGKFFEIFRFDILTGRISNPMQIPAGDQNEKSAFKYRAYGVEFSPTGRYGNEPKSGNYLFGTSRDGGQVYQWDLSLFDQNNQLQLVKTGQITGNPETQCGALQIAPNGKIYVAFNGQDYLGVINSPMRPDCRFKASGALLIDNDTGLGGLSGLGLPAAIPVVKNPEPFYFENLCFGDTTLFYITDQTSITQNTPRAWIFTKLSGGGGTVTKTSQTNELKYKFLTAGNFRVLLKVFKSGNPVTYTRYLTINPLPVVQLIKNSVKDTVQLCQGSFLVLDAGSGAFYEWEDVTIKDRKRTITTDDNWYNQYRAKVTDYHGCIGWDTVVTIREIPPTATHTSVKAFCGRNDGSATVIPNGKIENYLYTWEGYPNEKSNTLSGVNGGDYIVHVFNSSLCEVTDTIHVDELGGSSVKIVSSGDSIVCPGVPIKLIVTSAAEIEWITPSGLTGNDVTVNLDTTTIFTVKAISRDEGRECPTIVTDTIFVFPRNLPNLGDDRTSCAGWTVDIDGGEKYIDWNWSDGQTGRFARIKHDENALVLYAKDQNQCTFTDTVAVHFMPSPDVDLGKDTAVCSKEPITLSGGTGDSYLWSKLETTQTITLGTTQTITVNKTGDYILTITKDGCSLSDTIHVQLNDPDLFGIYYVSSKNITCYGANNGVIQVYTSGDGRDFYYSIDNGVTFLDNRGLFENVRPGNSYVLKVLEDSVCTVIYPVPIAISQPDSLVVKFCPLPPSCKECTDGEITVSITGGTPPYEIRMNGEIQDSITIKDLGLGSYSLTVTDSLQCTTSVPVVLAEGTRPEIISPVDQPACSGTPVTLRVTNSKRVEWINPPGSNNLEIVVYPQLTTTYLARSIKTDADGFACETILDYTVVVKPFIKPKLGDDINACVGDTIELNGGDYVSWEWSNGMIGRYINLFNTADPLVLSVKDDNGCFLKDSISVRFYPHPIVELGKDQALCSSEPLSLSDGTGESYLWSTGEQTREISVTKSDKYSLIITTNGCSSADSVNIKIMDPNSFSINSVIPTDNVCFAGELGSLEIVANGSGASIMYSIDGGATYQASRLFENLPSGGYSKIRISADSVCYKDFGAPVAIGQPDSIHVSYRLKSPGCETCNDGKLTLEVSGGTPPYHITLSGAPIELITETLGIGSYTIVVTDANLCAKNVEFKLELLREVPNVITTNGDGVNDLWRIPMLKYYPDAIAKVFTAAGKQVFVSDPGYPIPWDGKENGNFLPMGTYYYLINLGPGEEQLTGYLTILR